MNIGPLNYRSSAVPGLTIKELRQELKKRNARGYSRKSKAELIQQLNEMSTN